jgi:trehalose synthase
VGGWVGGIPSQVEDGQTGYLVSTVEECAERIGDVLRDPALAKELGRKGKEFVRTHFLMPRLLRDWLRIMLQMHV